MKAAPRARAFLASALAGFLCLSNALAQSVGALPSWNDGAAEARIVAFVNADTEQGGKDFVAPAERVGIHPHIGRRPIAAFGHFDGEFEMLAWTRPPRAAGRGEHERRLEEGVFAGALRAGGAEAA